jgi:uncharacterized protein
MRFEWDESKDRTNQKRHDGLDFRTAAFVFEDPDLVLVKDRVDENGEQRWHAIGAIAVRPDQTALLLVVHVYRKENANGEEIIRIISARAAEKREIGRYQKQAVD